PVWLLLTPRDYLSSFMKVGAVLLLAIGVILVNPRLRMPAFTPFVRGGGPVFPGTLFPFVFITIACGAISGFHSLIASGTTPKMIDRERHILPISYGAMVLEGFVGVVALVAACALEPADYFAINTPPAVFATLGMAVRNLHGLEAQVGETLAGRPGGAVSLAVGTSVLINLGRARYVWTTLPPLAFMCVNTLTAGWMNIGVNYLRPQLKAGAPTVWRAFLAAPWPARIQCVVTLVIMTLLIV